MRINSCENIIYNVDKINITIVYIDNYEIGLSLIISKNGTCFF